MSDADYQVGVAHHFAEEDGRNLRQLDRALVLHASEADTFKRPAFDFGRGAIGVLESHPGGDAGVVERFANAILANAPAACAPKGRRLARLHLMAGVSVRQRTRFFFRRSHDVELAEDL